MLQKPATYMRMAIEKAHEYDTPYGCVIVNQASGETIVAANQTRVNGKTAHAEMEALRQLTNKDWDVNNLVLYATGEPCPMCMGATIWCGITHVYFGVSIEKISQYHRQINISSKDLARNSWLSINIEGGLLEDECLQLFE